MAVLELFKKLATNSHYNVDINLLIKNLPEELRLAVMNKDGESLKVKIAGSDYLANESHVVQV